MSLVGTLQDLGLGEILQIVSLSRKTGILTLRGSDQEEGLIVFRQGQVVRAASSLHQQSLGRALIQKGVIDLDLLRNALDFQQEEGFRERLGVILINRFNVAREAIEEVVRQQIENAVFSLFEWSQGDFEFEMRDQMETVDGIKLDPLQFMLDQGLNPQFLALEGARLLDERRHRAGRKPVADEADGDAPLDLDFDISSSDGSDAAAPAAPTEPLVVVDDDSEALLAMAQGLREGGFNVHAVTGSEEALIKIDALFRSGARPTILIDLIMPKMDGSGVQGGIELLGLLRDNFRELPVIVMADYHRSDARATASGMVYPFILKPPGADMGAPEKLRTFISALLPEIRHVQAGQHAS